MRPYTTLKYTLLPLLLALLASCGSERLLDPDLLSDTPIRLEAGVDDISETRSTPNTDIQNHAFEAQQPISVYITTDETPAKVVGTSPITYTTSAADANYINTLTPDYQTYFPASTPVNIFAVYPSSVAPGDDGTTTFTVDANQTEGTYRRNDLMHAHLSSQPKTEQTLRLQFAHKMTKMVVKVDVEEELEISSIKLVNFYRSVVYTPSTGALGGLSNQSPITIENYGAALLPPQHIDGNFIEIETTLGKTATTPGKTAYFATTKTFEEGKEYVVSLKVGRVNLGLTANIVDWTQDGIRQVVEQTSADGYTIEYTQSLPFEESFRTSPYEQPGMSIKETATGNTLTRYTTDGADYDYSVLFFGNNQAGTATMVINGNPNKVNTQVLSWVKTFSITQLTGSLSYPAYSSAASYGYTYEESKLKVPYVNNGVVNWPCTAVCDPGAATYVSTNSTVATVSPSGTVTMHAVGEATIMVSSPGDGNYTAASTAYNLQVTKRTSAGLTVVLTDGGNPVTDNTYTYNGLPCTPSVAVYDGAVATENLLSPGLDYTVGFSNNLNAGTATVTVTGAGDYEGVVTKNFKINPITTTFNESYGNTSIAINSTLSRPATINHLFGTVTYSSSNSNIAAIGPSGTITTGSTTGTATITVSVAKPSPENYTAATMTYTVTVESYNAEYAFSGSNPTSSSYQTFTCNKAGTYLLEVWGASGYSPSTNYSGGKGAYVAGTVHLEKGQKLYIYVGGQGGASGAGGWNGGGKCTAATKNANCAGGGGATDISLCNGEWNSTAHLNSRIIVAGGGGGALYIYSANLRDANYANGGYGGAWNGRAGTGVNAYGRGGTRSGAGSAGSGHTVAAGFGYGGDYSGTDIVGCGGGGWYGGGSGGDNSRHGAGGGGSSYMWNSSSRSYYAGHGTSNAPTTTGSAVTDATKFYVTEIGKSSGMNEGNGKARITFVE